MTDDSRIYADLAANWLQHGVYGETQAGQPVPTAARLPGYPAFLAAIFAIFGVGSFKAVLLFQIPLDLLTCLLIADLTRRTVSDRTAAIAFALAALCPFLANYSAAVLTETLEILFTVLALDLAIAGLDSLTLGTTRTNLALWAGTGAAISACILLRPDGGILLAAIGAFLLLAIWRRLRTRNTVLPLLKAGITMSLCALIFLAPWTLRNLHTLHQFQPLAPRYATEQDEMVPRGFNQWVRTWMLDYTSVEEFYWNVPGTALDPTKLPNRAFDSARQKEQTLSLISDYNQSHDMTPLLDARFGALASERIRSHPVRYYVALPFLRIADMWLRPRTEILPPDPRWWEFNDVPGSAALTIAFGMLNLTYLAAVAASLLFSALRSQIRWLALLLLFVVLRSAFLGTLENPESRYTLECYPVVIVLAATALAGRTAPRPDGDPARV